MRLLDLPNELLATIIHSVDEDSDLNALAQTCRALSTISNPHLYKRDLQREESLAWTWATENDKWDLESESDRVGTTKRCLAVGTPASWGFPLRAAARNDSATVMALLLGREGVEMDLNTTGSVEPDYAPLLEAAIYGSERVAKLLLAREDVDRNVTDPHGNTPLSRAALMGNKVMVDILIADSCSYSCSCSCDYVNKGNHRGITPLMHAVIRGAVDTVGSLLSCASIDPNIRNDDNDDGGYAYHTGTALCQAAHCLFNIWDSGPREKGDEEERYHRIVEMLLAHPETKVDLARDTILSTMYWRSAQDGYEEMFRLFLEKGVERNPISVSGRDVLSCAAGCSRACIVRMMLADMDNISPDTPDADGRTALSHAMMPVLTTAQFESDDWHDAEVVRLLLETDRVEVDSIDHNGRTPLQWKMENAYRGADEVAKILLRYNAVVPVIDNDKDLKRFLRIALEGNNPVLSEILFDQLNERSPPSPREGRELLSTVISNRDCSEPVVRLVIQKCSNIDYNSFKDDDGACLPVIALAADNDRYDLLELLLAQSGLDVNAVGGGGKTGISTAINKLIDAFLYEWDRGQAGSRAAFVERLLAHKDVDTRTMSDEHLEWHISDLAQYDQHRIVERLIERDDRVNSLFTVYLEKEERVLSLLEWAQERGHENIVQLLQIQMLGEDIQSQRLDEEK